jgi:hypothetical protein
MQLQYLPNRIHPSENTVVCMELEHVLYATLTCSLGIVVSFVRVIPGVGSQGLYPVCVALYTPPF